MGWSPVKKVGNLPRRRPDDPFERIYRHYHDINFDMVLTPAEKNRLEVYEYAYDQYSKGHSRGSVAKQIMVKFSDQEIPRRTAYGYLHEAIDIFGDLDDVNIDREKRIFIEIGKNGLQKALEDGNMNAFATIYQSLNKIYRFNESTDELTEFLKKFKPMAIVLSSDPDVLKKEADQLVEDILHEDVEPDGES